MTPRHRRATVYLSYARGDTTIPARDLADALASHGYYLRGIEWDLDFENVQASIQRHIDDALAHGFVILLSSVRSAKKEFVRAAIEYGLAKAATDRSGLIVRVLFGDPEEVLAGSAIARRPSSGRSAGCRSTPLTFKALPPNWWPT